MTDYPRGAGYRDLTSPADQSDDVTSTAQQAGSNVADTAKQQASGVAAEAKEQAQSLFDTVRVEVGEQAGTQQQRIAEALHGLSDELGTMASSSPDSGPLTDLAKEGARRGGAIAHWLAQREPGEVLDEVRAYARRQPVTFLALCGLAGLVAGRLTRSAIATRTELDNADRSDQSEQLRSRPDKGVPPARATGPAPDLVGEATASGW